MTPSAKPRRYPRKFSLDHLSPSDFEEFCFELLHELGFRNVSWRKGTGLEASPADQGRDIECALHRTDVDGTVHAEKWFVECKHYAKGVPPKDLQGALSWAAAERPGTLLIIASNFLSNPTKEYLVAYQRENKPAFRIKYWEKPEIERLTLSRSQLLRKYNLVGELPFLSIIHPAHALFLKGPSNSLSYLFETLDGLDPEKRESLLSWLYLPVIQPRFRKPKTGDERLIDLMIDPISYEVLKEKCRTLVKAGMDERLLAFLVVSFALSNTFAVADTTSIDEVVSRRKREIEWLMSGAYKPEFPGAKVEEMVSRIEKDIAEAPERIGRNYDLYAYVCENVVQRLLEEPLTVGLDNQPDWGTPSS